MENEFKFGAMVQHDTMGKGVFLGRSVILYPDLPEIRHKVEVIFDRKQSSDSVNPNHLTPIEERQEQELPDSRKVSFTDGAGEEYKFRCERGDDVLIYGDDYLITSLLVRDVQKFIDCLSVFLDFNDD